MHNYKIYGENLSSFEDLLGAAGVDFGTGDMTATIAIRSGAIFKPAPKEWFQFSTDADGYVLQWKNIADFKINYGGGDVIIEPKKFYSKDVLCSYLLTQVIGFCLTLRGQEVLHATGVSYAGKNYFILGDSGVGKSTLAARILFRGGKLITDDVLVAKKCAAGKYRASRGLPRIKLYPDAIAASQLELSGAIPLSPYTDKTLCLIKEENFIQEDSVKIDRVFILNGSDEKFQLPRLKKLSGEEAILSLLHNTFNALDRRPERLKTQFNFVADFLRQNSIYEFKFARNLYMLDETIDYLFERKMSHENHL